MAAQKKTASVSGRGDSQGRPGSVKGESARGVQSVDKGFISL
jgi:hypothetical protein